MGWLNAKRFWTYGLLCVVAAWLVAKAPDAVTVVTVPAAKQDLPALSGARQSAAATTPRPLPERLDRPLLEPALRDPFATVIATPTRPSIPAPALVVKPDPAPKWQQQIEQIATLPRAKQQVVMQMLDGLLASAR